ncbi:hypothetical protein V6N12_064836 [Hibiscus sabdariffa]|uniref:DUF4378 domain-containing protein n=1 Tax=Hibiscus sabdariffa TaxID=183260 RepID=A0ABR2G6Y4_9ROSI
MNSGQHTKKHNREVSYSQVKLGMHDLEIFKINKDLFLDVIQDPEIGISQHFLSKKTSKGVKLTRSRSFLVSGSPCTQYLRFSTLETKHKELLSFRQGEISVDGTQLSQGSDSQRWHRLVISRLKDCKQLIKQILKQVSIKYANNKCRNEDGTDNEIYNGGLHRMRKTKSINESLDRYTKLLEHGVSKESDLHHSKSLRLSKEDQVPSREFHGPKFFRSISCIYDFNSFDSLQHAVSRDTLSFEVPIGSILNYDTNKYKDEHDEPQTINIHEGINKFELVEVELHEKMRERNNPDSSSPIENIAKPCDLIERINTRQEQESDFGENPSSGLTRPTSQGTFVFSKEKPTMLFESDKEVDPIYNYVRDILELSGFLQNRFLHSWYSPDQLLNPSLFKELETLLHPKLECSSINELRTNCDENHKLVFDLVNEVLVEISEKSYIYFPKPFSYGISLIFKRNIIFQEVWRKVSWNLGFQLEHDQSLDDIVGRDLEKDTWMIFQPEAEFVTLELDELIFEELLDELICL